MKVTIIQVHSMARQGSTAQHSTALHCTAQHSMSDCCCSTARDTVHLPATQNEVSLVANGVALVLLQQLLDKHVNQERFHQIQS